VFICWTIVTRVSMLFAGSVSDVDDGVQCPEVQIAIQGAGHVDACVFWLECVLSENHSVTAEPSTAHPNRLRLHRWQVCNYCVPAQYERQPHTYV
jgi:hypothetical protein